MNPEQERIERIKRLYGLSEQQWQALIESGKCPLCLKLYASNRLPAADHRHVDGLVRGALCVSCNYDLGVHHDNAGWLRRAADYLDNPPALALIGEVYVPGSIGEHRGQR